MAGATLTPHTGRPGILRRYVAALRHRRHLVQLHRSWVAVAERAGVDAVLVDVECNPGSTVLTVELPTAATPVHLRNRIAAAMQLDSASSLMAFRDLTNPRRVLIHHLLDPWADERELAHPLMALVTAMNTDTEEAA